MMHPRLSTPSAISAVFCLLLAGVAHPALAQTTAPAPPTAAATPAIHGLPPGVVIDPTKPLDPQRQFLVDNAARKGVKVTKSGVHSRLLKDGAFGARSPKSMDTVKVHYEGRLIDGTIFDSSFQRGEPAVFSLNEVIRGWTDGVGMMRVGEVRELVIPAELAYGDRGHPPMVRPGATLIFKVELLEVMGEPEPPKKMTTKKKEERS